MHTYLLAVRTGLFAQGRFLGKVLDEWVDDTQEFIRSKLPHLVVAAIIAFALYRLLNIITARMVRIAEQHAAAHNRIAQVKTMAGVIRATGLAIIITLVTMQFLAAVGVNLAPLLASAGIAGVAIGLAAQNIVRDGDGTLYVIPNSQITTVANLSIDYSVATVNVSVDFSANPDSVMKMLQSIATDIRNSEEFRNLFVEDPKVLGLDAVRGSEIIFPVVFKTEATRQYGPIREFRRRVRLALEENHLLPGDPGRVYRASLDPASATVAAHSHATQTENDPTTAKAPEGNPFTGD